MSVSVDLDDLLAAYEWVSAGEVAALDAEAYIDRLTGQIHWCGEGVDEEAPEDIDDESLYIAVPHKSEFDLGRSLALAFVDEYLPHSSETVRARRCLHKPVNSTHGTGTSSRHRKWR
jgi:hypothetical protein